MHLIPDQRWTEELAHALAPLCDAFTPLEFYRDGVILGTLTVERAYGEDTRPCGWALWRVDHYKTESALVIVAAVGTHPTFSLADCVLPLFDDMARARGCKAVRFHTTRHGLARLAALHGYGATEYVFRKVMT